MPLAPGPLHVPLRRAPRIDRAVEEVFGQVADVAVLPLRELLGITNAHRQRRRGIVVARSATGASTRTSGCSRRPARTTWSS